MTKTIAVLAPPPLLNLLHRFSRILDGLEKEKQWQTGRHPLPTIISLDSLSPSALKAVAAAAAAPNCSSLW